jgi:stage V sporulation protein R
MLEDIERRWNHPTLEEQTRLGRTIGQGRAKLFEVREFESDCSFIRNYITKTLVDDLDLYVFEKQGITWTITDQRWENVRDQLVYSRVNVGFPYLVVEDGDFEGSGALYLKHRYEGIELEVKDVERTLPSVYALWQKPVYLETVIDQKPIWFTFDGTKHNRKFL